MKPFESHQGYQYMFKENQLTLGLFFPIESYEGSMPEMDLDRQINLAKKAEEMQFASLFVRDIPLYDPHFGDAGQIYDPWVFLSYLAAQTQRISLATGSIVTTLRHPLHVAKAASSIDRISGNRLVLGIATGDRPIEFDAFAVDHNQKSQIFQESLQVIRRVWKEDFPDLHTNHMRLQAADLLPKPALRNIPVLITGHSGQTRQWIAEHGDGWLFYPRPLDLQSLLINEWRALSTEFKPFSQSLLIDLSEDPNERPTGLQLGFRSGRQYLLTYLHKLQERGVNHVVLSLKHSKRPIEDVVQEIGEDITPHFPAHQT